MQKASNGVLHLVSSSPSHLEPSDSASALRLRHTCQALRSAASAGYFAPAARLVPFALYAMHSSAPCTLSQTCPCPHTWRPSEIKNQNKKEKL